MFCALVSILRLLLLHSLPDCKRGVQSHGLLYEQHDHLCVPKSANEHRLAGVFRDWRDVVGAIGVADCDETEDDHSIFKREGPFFEELEEYCVDAEGEAREYVCGVKATKSTITEAKKRKSNPPWGCTIQLVVFCRCVDVFLMLLLRNWQNLLLFGVFACLYGVQLDQKKSKSHIGVG